jgi:hypothetical protein
MMAGLYMLASGTEDGFTEADRSAVEAVTNAGTAALHAEIESSPVALGPSLLQDTRLRASISGTSNDLPPPPEGVVSLQDTLYEVANETLLKDYPLMSVAFVDKQAQIVAKTGMYENHFDELVLLDEVKNSDGEARFSATLGGKLHAVQISRPVQGAQSQRLIAIQAVDLGGNSLLRRVLGTYPAGIVRDGKVVGDAMGGANPGDLVQLVTDNIKEVPPSDASKVFELGAGPDTRIGSISRVPGPAGKGAKPSYLAVLSLHSLGIVDRDLASALKASKELGLPKVPWPLVGGFLFIALAFAWYLPHMESTAPMRRLTAEFNGIVEGSQHQVFHDTYKGELRNVARSAVNAQEAMRMNWEDEFAAQGGSGEADYQDEPASGGGASPEPHYADNSDEPSAIELPSMESDGGIESHSHSAADPEPEPEPAPPKPDPEPEISGGGLGFDDESSALSSDLGFGGGGGGGAALPEPFNAGSDGAAEALLADGPSSAPADPQEAYFREVFEEFVSLKQTCGEDTSKFGYEKFAAKLRKNTESLKKKPGVTDVKFNVYIKDGKAALKAKVIKG